MNPANASFLSSSVSSSSSSAQSVFAIGGGETAQGTPVPFIPWPTWSINSTNCGTTGRISNEAITASNNTAFATPSSSSLSSSSSSSSSCSSQTQRQQQFHFTPQQSADFSLSVHCHKTEMCRFFKRSACKKGTACTYAHSEDELGAKPDLSKTKLCKMWISKEGCPHPAEQCKYAHGETELRHRRTDIAVLNHGSSQASTTFSSSCYTTATAATPTAVSHQDSQILQHNPNSFYSSISQSSSVSISSPRNIFISDRRNANSEGSNGISAQLARDSFLATQMDITLRNKRFSSLNFYSENED